MATLSNRPVEDLAYACRLLAAAEARIRNLEAHLAQTQARFDSLNEKHADVIGSSGWRWVMRYRRLRNRLFPEGTRVHRFLTWLARAVTVKPTFRVPRRFLNDYERWIALHEPVAFAAFPARPVTADSAPTISLLLMEGDDLLALKATLDSVLAQTDPNWQLCIASKRPRELPEDPRVCFADTAAASASQAERLNAALAKATGGFIGVIEAGRLAPHAIAVIRQSVAKHPEIGILYSDEDAIDKTVRRDPIFKPDWSPETFRAQPYLGHLTLLRRDLVEKAGSFRPEFDGAAIYDLALRVSEAAPAVRHLPLVLYHSGKRKGSLPRPHTDAGARAVQAHIERLGWSGNVSPGMVPGMQQVRYRVAGDPLVSIIIPSKDQPELLERCVESVLVSDYPHREIVLLDNGSQTPRAQENYARLAERQGVRVVAWNHPFNYAAINNFGVRAARGAVLLFLNNDMEVITRDWLERLLEHALRPEVGAVGAKLLYADGTVQHAGVIVGMNDQTSGHYFKGFPGDAPGYLNRLVTVQNLSAVTGACLMMRRTVFEQVGGFDEQFAVNFNDIDLCLKVRTAGYQVIWTPHARLFHY